MEETNEVETPQVIEDKHVWGQEKVTKTSTPEKKEKKPTTVAYMSKRNLLVYPDVVVETAKEQLNICSCLLYSFWSINTGIQIQSGKIIP